MTEEGALFDFAAHGREATVTYLARQGFYSDLAACIKMIIVESLGRRQIRVHSVEARSKDPASFAKKASQQSESDPAKPKYPKPLEQITDLAATRVITYFPSTIDDIDNAVGEEFEIVERSDKGAELLEEERFGYNSIHYLVKLTPERAHLPEYRRFADATSEIQVRTILQHAWAEIEHDIQYKSASVIPVEIRRRFTSLAGVLEIADREFQAIQDADARLTKEARSRVEGGQLAEVEITPDAVKTFLDKRLGADGRISEFSYDWTARMLRKLGFRTLAQVDRCIQGFNDDAISRILSGSRQGQTTRFEYMLLAGMGEFFLKRVFVGEHWYGGPDHLRLLRERGITLRDYDPLTDPDTPSETT